MTRHGERGLRTAVIACTAIVLVLAVATPALAAVRVRATALQTFRPRKVTISAGTRVIWKAFGTRHTVTAYRGSWAKDSTIDPGETTSFRFRNPGRYRYRCTIHSSLVDGVCSGMCGKVIVR